MHSNARTDRGIFKGIRFFAGGLLFVLFTAPALASDGSSFSWPAQWTAFGPVPAIPGMSAPQRSDLLSGQEVVEIQDVLTIDGVRYEGRRLPVEAHGFVDLDLIGRSEARGQVIYLMAPVRATETTTRTLGAGADWWMQWWLNGEPVYDTLESGNRNHPIAVDNHTFELTFEPGEHVLAVAVVRGTGSFAFAAGDPESAPAPEADGASSNGHYAEAMQAGEAAIAKPPWARSRFDNPVIHFSEATAHFERAVQLAEGVEEKVDALLALGGSRLGDYHDRDYAAIRALFHEAEQWAERDLPSGGTPIRRRAILRARAVLGAGRSYLEEGRTQEARAELERVHAARFGAIQGHTPQTFVCLPTNMTLRDAQYYIALAYLQEHRIGDAHRVLNDVNAHEDLDLGLKGRRMLGVIRQLPWLRQEHPRLLFNEDTWPAIRQRALTTERRRFDAMRERVMEYSLAPELDGSARFPATVRGPAAWGVLALEAAFVYRVTGEAEMLDRARLILRDTLDYYLERSVSRTGGMPRIAFVCALDTVWNDLDPDERNALRAGLLEYTYALFTEDAARGVQLGYGTHNYERNISRYAGMLMADPRLDGPDYMRALEVWSRDAFGNVHSGELNWFLARHYGDGPQISMLDYLFFASLEPLWVMMHSWDAALGQRPPSPDLVYVGSPDYVLRNMLGLDGGFQHFSYARSWNRRGGINPRPLAGHLAHMQHFYAEAHPAQAAIAGHLRERMEAEGFHATYTLSVAPFLLDVGSAPEPGLPDGLPIARHFTRAGQILMSSGFGPEDTYALFSCGGNQSEGHFDSTHFTLFKQGYLALDSGTRAHEQMGILDYTIQTVAHNCILIRMPGEQMPYTRSNSGGQRRPPRDAVPLAFESNEQFAYVATDATPVYHEEKCEQMVRQFLFFPPDHFVVFDRVTSTRGEYPKTWLLHTANEPQIQGRVFHADQGGGRIFSQTLLPADAVVEPIGGPGKEFWADGRNWPIPDDSPHRAGLFEEDGNLAEQIGRWRVEVRPGASREVDHFLHLIQAADQTVDAMAPSRMNENDDTVELVFAAGGREIMVRLNKTGTVGGAVRITEADGVVWDRPLTESVHPQSGLVLAGEPAQEQADAPPSGPLISWLTQPGASGARLEYDPRVEAALILSRMGSAAAADFRSALAHSEVSARRLSAWGLGRIGVPGEVRVLAEALGDEDGFVRAAAAAALESIGASAVSEARAALKSPSPEIRRRAATVLGAVRAAQAADDVIVLLDDPERAVRIAAAESLGRMRAAGAVPALIPMLMDEEYVLRRRVLWALREILTEEQLVGWLERRGMFLVEGLDDPNAARREAAAQMLVALAEPAVPLLLAALDSPVSRLRRHAADVLWRMPVQDPRAVSPLLDALEDEDDGVRAGAAGALGALADRRAVEPLIRLLDDPVDAVQDRALASLVTMADPRAASALSRLFARAETPDQRAAAADALGAGGETAVETLIEALQDTDPTVRGAAARSLGRIGDPRALKPLLEAERVLFEDPRRLGPYVVRTPVVEARQLVIEAIGSLDNREDAIDALIALLERAGASRGREATGPTVDFLTVRLVNEALETATGHQVSRVYYPTLETYRGFVTGWKQWRETHDR